MTVIKIAETDEAQLEVLSLAGPAQKDHNQIKIYEARFVETELDSMPKLLTEMTAIIIMETGEAQFEALSLAGPVQEDLNQIRIYVARFVETELDSIPSLLTEMMEIRVAETDEAIHVRLRMDFLEVEVVSPLQINEL